MPADAPLPTPHGFADTDRARTLRRRPPAAALAWVEGAVGGTVRRVTAYRGGSSSAIHGVHLTTGTVVLRRYVIDDVVDEEPDIVEREAHVLALLDERCPSVPTPRPLAADPAGGDAGGAPALLMSRLPGRLDWSPTDLDPWLRKLAELLPAVHATPVDDADAGVQPFRPYRPEHGWDPPPWLADRALWDRLVEVFHAPMLDDDRVFIHRDFHPGNVLFRRGRVSGVVDWQSASVGPRTADVWHCRANLLGRFGLDVADRFLRIWEEVSGDRAHPGTEAVMLVDTLGWSGARTERERRDLETVARRVLAELG